MDMTAFQKGIIPNTLDQIMETHLRDSWLNFKRIPYVWFSRHVLAGQSCSDCRVASPRSGQPIAINCLLAAASWHIRCLLKSTWGVMASSSLGESGALWGSQTSQESHRQVASFLVVLACPSLMCPSAMLWDFSHPTLVLQEVERRLRPGCSERAGEFA